MKAFWNKISNSGIEPGMNAQLVKKIKTTNQVAFSLSLIATCYLFVFYFLGYKKEGIAVTLVVLSIIAPIALNYFKLYFFARIWFLAALNIAVFIYSHIFGADAGIQLTYFSFVCIPWVIFEFHDRKYIIAGILMSVAGYYIFNYSDGYPMVTIAPDVQHGIYLSMGIVVFLILSLSIMFFVYNQNVTEKFLIEANTTLEVRNEKLKEISWIQSHKLRRPVATILGLIQLINHKDPSDPENEETLNHINTAGKELDNIISEINDLTHISKEE